MGESLWYVLICIGVCTILNGCGLMGVRNFEGWKGGPRWEFSEGLDFHVGANSIDHVEDKRGVNKKAEVSK